MQFSAMCQSSGARSLSDLARSALKRMLTHPTEEALITERLKVFDELIAALAEKLRQVSQILQENGSNGSSNQESKG